MNQPLNKVCNMRTKKKKKTRYESVGGRTKKTKGKVRNSYKHESTKSIKSYQLLFHLETTKIDQITGWYKDVFH